MNKNNWYVITGGPSAGKTTVLLSLKQRGYKIVHEAARIYIDQQIAKGKTIEEIRADEGDFQKKILDLKVTAEKQLPKDELIILDRGIPDSIAYYEYAGLSTKDPYLKETVKNCGYKKIFLLELLDLEEDYARTDVKDSKLIHDLLEKYYKKEGFAVINVPKMPVPDRVDFIVKNL